MNRKIIIDANFSQETRVVLVNKNNIIEDLEFCSSNKKQIKGNIYLGKITRIEPSLQAAFIDYGEEKAGFLPFSEIHPNYYNIPSSDKQIPVDEIEINNIDDLDEQDEIATHTEKNIDIDSVTKMIEDNKELEIDIEAGDDEIEKCFDKVKREQKNYKIQEVIKKGQIILIQVSKGERGNKGAMTSSYISLVGKYCVFMPNTPFNNGISRKILNNKERNRLKDVINKINPEENNKISSIIIRTSGMLHGALEIKKDYEYLLKLWNKIRNTTLKSQAPSFIYQENELLLKTVRDLFNKNVKHILIQGSDTVEHCSKLVQEMIPDRLNAVREYKHKTPIYTKFGIEDQLAKLYQPTVNLKSGGYIVINPTEALVAIDVNSGKATSESGIEEMALKTNLEAAYEIARQSRIRDLSGLIVIDFIDMKQVKNRKIIERAVWEYFSDDRSRIQTSQISKFGLLEMSRQRLRPSFLEMNSDMCVTCDGKGIVRTKDSNIMLILRTIENEIYNEKCNQINIYCMSSTVLYVLNEKRKEIERIEEKYSVKLNFIQDLNATADNFSIEKIKFKKKKDYTITPLLNSSSEIYNHENDCSDDKKAITKEKGKHRSKIPGKINHREKVNIQTND